MRFWNWKLLNEILELDLNIWNVLQLCHFRVFLCQFCLQLGKASCDFFFTVCSSFGSGITKGRKELRITYWKQHSLYPEEYGSWGCFWDFVIYFFKSMWHNHGYSFYLDADATCSHGWSLYRLNNSRWWGWLWIWG